MVGDLENVAGNGQVGSGEGSSGSVEAGRAGERKYRLFIGIPTYGKPDSLFSIDSGWDMMFGIGRHHPEIEAVMVQRDVRTYRQEARKGIVEAAQQWGATHLLMLDDDHVFDGSVFDKLWEHRDLPGLVSALYMTRGIPCAPCIWRCTSKGTVPIMFYPPNELIKVDVVGFGFVLYDMKVFERINPPWFNLGFGFGEDAAFCARVLMAGMGVYCHTGAKIGHILESPQVVTEETYLGHRNRIQMAESQLAEVGRDDGGSRKQQVGSRPWWVPSPAKRWFGYGRGADGSHQEGHTPVREALRREATNEEAFAEAVRGGGNGDGCLTEDPPVTQPVTT